LTPTLTPTATPLIKPGNEIISRENVNQLTLLGQIGKGKIYAIAWSRDGEKLVLGTSVGIYICKSKTLEQEKFIYTGIPIISIDISPDNLTLISGNNAGEIELWDVSSSRKTDSLHKWMFPEDGGANVAFSSDGLIMASVGMEEFGNYYLTVWDTLTGKEIYKFFIGDPFTGIEYFNFSDDGHYVVIGGTGLILSRLTNNIERSEKRIFIWDLNEQKLLQTLEDITSEINWIIGAGFNSDNSKLWVAYSNNTLAYWDVIEEQLINKRVLEQDGLAIYFSRDGTRMALSENHDRFDFYEVENGTYLNTLEDYSSGSISLLKILDDKSIAAIIGSNFNILDINTGDIQSNYFAFHSESAISSDGDLIAYTDPHNDTEIIHLINLFSGDEIFALDGHIKRISALAFSPDKKLLVSGGLDNKALLWDLETGTLLDTFNIYDSVGDLAFSPDGQKLAVCTRKDVQIWDINLGLLMSTLTGYYDAHAPFSFAIAFSSDSMMLASGNYFGPIHLFYTPTGVLLKYLEGHTGKINSLSFTPDGSMLVSASSDRSIRFWNIETGEEIAIIEDLPGAANSILFSEDGEMLISGGEDGIIRFWGIP
jgi:WD40 repeat protein